MSNLLPKAKLTMLQQKNALMRVIAGHCPDTTGANRLLSVHLHNSNIVTGLS